MVNGKHSCHLFFFSLIVFTNWMPVFIANEKKKEEKLHETEIISRQSVACEMVIVVNNHGKYILLIFREPLCTATVAVYLIAL